LTENEFSKMFI